LYFSKSIDEVTTSTGLITSKWEEAWPADNVLDISYDLEEINALLSDGTTLYLGTSNNIYRLLGTSSSNFTIPETIFRGVGVLSQDTWTVVYKDNIPAGYMWVTADHKVMLSDFNTYNEVGRAINNLIIATTNGVTHVQSISYGPYSFVVFSLENTSGSFPSFLIFDTKSNGWYRWNRQLEGDLNGVPIPIFSYTLVNGVQRMYMIFQGTVSSTAENTLQYLDPNATNDVAVFSNPISDIPWTVETSWINLMDTATSVVLNEMEVWTEDPNTNVSVWVSNNSANLDYLAFSPPAPVKTGPIVIGPLHTQKFFLAGTGTFGRYHRVRFFTNSSTGLSINQTVLRQFQFEFFPQTRV